MKLVVVFAYEDYDSTHSGVACVEHESPEQFYLDLQEAVNSRRGYLKCVGGYEFFLDNKSFDSLKVFTLDQFWEEYKA